MGAWGIQPEECDRADDWLIGLWEDTDVYSHLAKTIESDSECHHEEIRVAINVALALEKFGVIPYKNAVVFWQLAKTQLESIKTNDVYHGEDFQKAMSDELQLLDQKLNTLEAADH